MNEKVAEECVDSCLNTFKEFVKGVGMTDEAGIMEVIFHEIDESFLYFAFIGFEIKAMGEAGKIEGWKPCMFGRAINMLLAEYFGRGSRVTTLEWHRMTEKALEAITEDGYNNHSRITPEVMRAWIRM